MIIRQEIFVPYFAAPIFLHTTSTGADRAAAAAAAAPPFVSRRRGQIYGGGAGVGEGNKDSSSLSSHPPTARRDENLRR